MIEIFTITITLVFELMLSFNYVYNYINCNFFSTISVFELLCQSIGC